VDSKGYHEVNELRSSFQGEGGSMLRHLAGNSDNHVGPEEWLAFFAFIKSNRGAVAMSAYIDKLRAAARRLGLLDGPPEEIPEAALTPRSAALAKLAAVPASDLTPQQCRELLLGVQSQVAKLELIKATQTALCIAWPHGGDSVGIYQVLLSTDNEAPAAVAIVESEEYSDPLSSMYHGDDGKIRYVISALKSGTKYHVQVVAEEGWNSEVVTVSTVRSSSSGIARGPHKVVTGMTPRDRAPSVVSGPRRHGARYYAVKGKASHWEKDHKPAIVVSAEELNVLKEALLDEV